LSASGCASAVPPNSRGKARPPPASATPAPAVPSKLRRLIIFALPSVARRRRRAVLILVPTRLERSILLRFVLAVFFVRCMISCRVHGGRPALRGTHSTEAASVAGGIDGAGCRRGLSYGLDCL